MFLVIIPAMVSGWKLTLSKVIFMSVGLVMSAFSTYKLIVNDEGMIYKLVNYLQELFQKLMNMKKLKINQ